MHSKTIKKLFYTYINFTDLSYEEKIMVLGWRNHGSVRKWMYNTDPIKEEDHFKFIKNLQTDPSKIFFLIKREDEYVGVYSLVNIKDNAGQGGFYLSPKAQEKNLSVEFCYYIFSYLFDSLNIEKIYGFALIENKSANSLNRLFGFSEQRQIKNVNDIEQTYYFGELTRQKWVEEIALNPRILKLVNYSINNIKNSTEA